MAMIRVEPLEVRVRADWFDGRPREVTLHGRRLPRPGGHRRPRRELRVPGRHRAPDALRGRDGGRPLQLAFRHRSRRWTVRGHGRARAPPSDAHRRRPSRRCDRGGSLPAPGHGRAARCAAGPILALARRSQGRGAAAPAALGAVRRSVRRGWPRRLTAAVPVRPAALGEVGPHDPAVQDLLLSRPDARPSSPSGSRRPTRCPAAAAHRRSRRPSAASLVAMVATLSQGRPKYAEHARSAQAAIPAAQALADELLRPRGRGRRAPTRRAPSR